MEENNILKLIDNEGNILEYEIILVFKWLKTNKNYLVYTDNNKNEDGKLNIYAAIFDPSDDTKFEGVETEEEWNEIEARLKKLDKEGE